MSEKKLTKTDVLNAIIEVMDKNRNLVVTLEDEVQVTAMDILNYCGIALEQIRNKATKAAEKAREKAAEGDALVPVVKEKLTDEFKTVESIVEEIGQEDVTRNKVVARLTKLVKEGVVVKDSIKVEGKKNKVTVYKLA